MKKSLSLVLTTLFFKNLSGNYLRMSHMTHSKCAQSKELVSNCSCVESENLRNEIRTSALMSLYILITIIKSTWASLFGTWVSLHPWFLCSDSAVSAARAIGLSLVIWDQLSLVSILNCALHPACFKLESKAKLCCPGNLKQHHQDDVLCHSVWISNTDKIWLSAGCTFHHGMFMWEEVLNVRQGQ